MKRVFMWILIGIMICAMPTAGVAEGLEAAYNEALLLLTQGKYLEAAQAFDSLFGYSESNQYATYAKALNAGETGEYDLAIQAFELLGDFRDCKQQIKYYEARREESYGDFSSLDIALERYREMQLFRDSMQRIEDIEIRKRDAYDAALVLGRQGNFMDAYMELIGMNGYELSDDYARYYSACADAENDNFDSGLYTFAHLRALRHLDKSGGEARCAEYADRLLNHLQPGSLIRFGTQSWYVLEIDANEKRMLLLSEDILDKKLSFITTATNSFQTWDESRIREWLNNEYYDGFLSDYFYDNEIELIETTPIPLRYYVYEDPFDYTNNTEIDSTSFNLPWNDGVGFTMTSLDATVYDKVFALSIDEALQYLSDLPDAIMIGQDYHLRDSGYIYVYTRNWVFETVKESRGHVFNMCSSGEIRFSLDATTFGGTMNIRPALWVNLN